MSTQVIAVAAHSLNQAIGRNNEIPWHYPEDFAHFKRETLGKTLIMGRATWDSIGRPLPGRNTIVLTRSKTWQPKGYEDRVGVAHSLRDGLTLAAAQEQAIVIAGGEQVYRAAQPFLTHQILTTIPLIVESADAFYPDYDEADWTVTRLEETNGLTYRWLERRSAPQAI